MRALSGAIITAGALIGLGLTALGFGIRYQNFTDRTEALGPYKNIPFYQLDHSLVLILVVLLIVLVIGLGIAFLGLAFHHERRHHERLHRLAQGAGHEAGGPRSLP